MPDRDETRIEAGLRRNARLDPITLEVFWRRLNATVYGDPSKRDRSVVAFEAEEELISKERARADYGWTSRQEYESGDD